MPFRPSEARLADLFTGLQDRLKPIDLGLIPRTLFLNRSCRLLGGAGIVFSRCHQPDKIFAGVVARGYTTSSRKAQYQNCEKLHRYLLGCGKNHVDVDTNNASFILNIFCVQSKGSGGTCGSERYTRSGKRARSSGRRDPWRVIGPAPSRVHGLPRTCTGPSSHRPGPIDRRGE